MLEEVEELPLVDLSETGDILIFDEHGRLE